MRLRFETDWGYSEGSLVVQVLEVEIKNDATIEEKQKECERFLKYVEKLMKD